jgi:hypothetical protein
VNGRRNSSYLSSIPRRLLSVADRSILHEEAFRRMLSLEKKRAQRSGKPFLLALLELDNQLVTGKGRNTLDRVMSVLASTTRETDVTGWSADGDVVGVMFTEIGTEERDSTVATITTRVTETLRSQLHTLQFSQVVISFQIFPPEEREQRVFARAGAPSLYSELVAGSEAGRLG